ncbi:MAG: hypothetical protein FRX48_00449 [Lasallia pustulata]|uniref:Uncharacterized protein n=1 Tax=Lasallia pustulata TaxID=136370 RepID=A0A5M8Q3Z2_9LECA|nr:MAG: hypothetical protein FRX48_00449 [Lasallia pustulata]
MMPTSQASSSMSQTDTKPARPKSARDTSAPTMSHSFKTSARSSTAPLQAEVANTALLAASTDTERPSLSIHDIPQYCCRVCEIESLPSTQSYDGPDDFHPLRFVGSEATEEWVRIHCAPMDIEQQVVRDRKLHQQLQHQRHPRQENEQVVQSTEPAPPLATTPRRRATNADPSPNARSQQPMTAGRGGFRVEQPQQQVTPDDEPHAPVSPSPP